MAALLRVHRLLDAALIVAESPRAILAAATWPKFSLASYRLVSRLVVQGLRPRTVIDVGANVGQFAVAAAKLFPRAIVHSFEPAPQAVGELERNVASLGSVTVYPFALGERRGNVQFRLNIHSHSSSILSLTAAHMEAFPRAQEAGVVSVRLSTLDEVFAGLDIPRPVLLKLDVQGYEAQTLRGGVETLRRIDYVVLEASFRPLYEGELLFRDLLIMMEDYGFRFKRPVGWLAAPTTGEVLQMDALFERMDIAAQR